MTDETFSSRTARLIGDGGVQKLASSTVLILGLGGVGGYVLEGLCRAGVGHFILADCDVFSESNLNRQILATRETVGKKKTEVARDRVKSINPTATVELFDAFLDAGNIPALLSRDGINYVVDAVDNVTAKIAAVTEAKRRGIPVLTCMGTGNHLDPSRFVVGDLESSSVCPLARVMRTELRKRGISGVTALWSTEPPVKGSAPDGERLPPASVSFVPSVAGLYIAGYVIRALAGVGEPDEHRKDVSL